MRRLFFMLLGSLVCSAFAVGCDDTMRSSYYDLGVSFKPIGEPCKADVPPISECGYAPQFYCTASGICAAACNTNADCTDGAVCGGSGDMRVGECRLQKIPTDGGQD